MRVRILQYRGRCIGCNACVEENKNRWMMSRKDGKGLLIGGTETKGISRIEVPEDEYDSALGAAAKCTVNIIKVERIN
jgi:ferredoxin